MEREGTGRTSRSGPPLLLNWNYPNYPLPLGGGSSCKDAGMKKTIRSSRMRMLAARTPGPCHLCGGMELELPGERWVADHLLPQALGGGDVELNLAKAHSFCNEVRGARPLTAATYDLVQRRRRQEIAIELG